MTQVLRELHLHFGAGFMFKGGTSLSKGYGIIERFSEDVDVLVVSNAGASVKEGERHLEAMTDAVAAALGLSWHEQRAPSRGRLAGRGDLLEYPQRIAPGIGVSVRAGVVLLEAGYGEGQEPCEMVTIRTLVGEALGITDDYEDLGPFRLQALEPRRTLIEKLFALHHVASTWDGSEEPAQRRFGRHYYDVYQLLGHPETLNKLKRRAEFDNIVGEVERISTSQFGGTTPRPAGGFATSPAFESTPEP